MSADTRRIVSLPVEPPPESASDATWLVRRPGGVMRLRPIQSAALHRAIAAKGLLAPIGVGHGKTLLSALLPVVLGAHRPLLLIPPTQRADFAAQCQVYEQHFWLHDNLTVMSYDALSRPEAVQVLETLAPDLIVADEAHRLSDTTSTRTRRFLRYCREARPMFCGMSGSFTQRSLADYAHLSALALGIGSPLPLDWAELQLWCTALDAAPEARVDVGGCFASQKAVAVKALAPLARAFPSLEGLRGSYQDRLFSAPGVVGTVDSACDVPLTISGIPLQADREVTEALQRLGDLWELPDGTELVGILEYARARSDLHQGFYRTWVEQPAPSYMAIRSAWCRSLRTYLSRPDHGLDSPALVERAALAGACPDRLCGVWAAWRPLRDLPEPPTHAVWVSDCVVQQVAAWLEAGPGIAWLDSADFAARLQGAAPFAWHPGVGERADVALATFTQAIPCALSIQAHGTGKNLQRWNRNLVVSAPPNGRTWEQLIGRTHRPGQTAPMVTVEYLSSDLTDANLEAARRDARYAQETLRQPQKILSAVQK